MSRSHPGPRWLLGAVLLATARPAAAWDPETHRSIVRAALLLSPAAEARMPLVHADGFFRDAETGDLLDRNCESHHVGLGGRDPAVEAEKLYRALTAPGSTLTRYQRAQTLGRYLHFVADCARPTAIAGGRVTLVPNLFANVEMAIFRERRRLALPLAASLREHGATAQAFEESPGALAATFRLAVNLVVDALLLFPAPAGQENAPEAGRTLFVVNHLDTGQASRGYSNYYPWYYYNYYDYYYFHYYYYSSYPYYDGRGLGWSPGYWDPDAGWIDTFSAKSTSLAPAVWDAKAELSYRASSGNTRRPPLLERLGVQVVEWAVRRREEGAPVQVEALLFNNFPGSACQIEIKTPTWVMRLPDTVAPDSLTRVAFEVPSGAVVDDLLTLYSVTNCTEKPTRSSYRIGPRFVTGSRTAAPAFENGRDVELPAPKKPPAPTASPTPQLRRGNRS